METNQKTENPFFLVLEFFELLVFVVNFCDCEDLSDEFGTSACSGKINQSDKLPVFYCEKGSPKTVWRTLVDDGRCDCCDGSDEKIGNVKCPNKC